MQRQSKTTWSHLIATARRSTAVLKIVNDRLTPWIRPAASGSSCLSQGAPAYDRVSPPNGKTHASGIPCFDTQLSETRGPATSCFSGQYPHVIGSTLRFFRRRHTYSWRRKALKASGSSGPPQYDISWPRKNCQKSPMVEPLLVQDYAENGKTLSRNSAKLAKKKGIIVAISVVTWSFSLLQPSSSPRLSS